MTGVSPRGATATGRRWIPAIILVSFLFAEPSWACPVCFGESDSAMADGVNNAILVLLGVVGVVQVGFIALFWSFWRRMKELRREGAQPAAPGETRT